MRLGLQLDLDRVPRADELEHAGRPAPCLPHEGMPAYESETGKILVYENLLPGYTDIVRNTIAGPAHYNEFLDEQGLVRFGAGARRWRPILYSFAVAQIIRLGSQMELGWRQVFGERNRRLRVEIELLKRLADRSVGSGEPWERFDKRARRLLQRIDSTPLPVRVANERARKLLRSFLTPQQRLDYAADRRFYVRGEINRLYVIESDNGFAICNPSTHEPGVRFCLHPEAWLPPADVALAHKLALEGGSETEAALLKASRPRIVREPVRSPTKDELHAAELEAALAS